MLSTQLHRQEITSLFYHLKFNEPCRLTPVIPILKNGLISAQLRVVSRASLKDRSEIELLAAWRKKNARWFPSQFKVTLKGTKKWAKEQLLEKEDRILFMIEDLKDEPIGHMGLYRFNFVERFCEIDNVIRGKAFSPGMMTAALNTLCVWGFSELKLKSVYLRVFADNGKAVALYTRAGFKEVEKILLRKRVRDNAVIWEEVEHSSTQTQRYFLRMRRMKYL